MAHPRVMILGIPIDNVDVDAVIAKVETFFAEGQTHHIVTVNPEFVMEAQHNRAFRDVLLNADLATPDGFGLLLAARWLGTPLCGRATGVELTSRIAELCARIDRSIFLLGAAPGVAEQAAAVLCQRFPGLRIAGCFSGSPRRRHEPFLQQIIRAVQPDVLLVAYGHPAQDLWIARNQQALQVPVAMGVGGTFDYLAGRVPHAPRLIRHMGLEWLYRLVRQPRRWRRIVRAVPLFAWTVLRHGRHFVIP